jgi:hypothetical protein
MAAVLHAAVIAATTRERYNRPNARRDENDETEKKTYYKEDG